MQEIPNMAGDPSFFNAFLNANDRNYSEFFLFLFVPAVNVVRAV